MTAIGHKLALPGTARRGDTPIRPKRMGETMGSASRWLIGGTCASEVRNRNEVEIAGGKPPLLEGTPFTLSLRRSSAAVTGACAAKNATAHFMPLSVGRVRFLLGT